MFYVKRNNNEANLFNEMTNLFNTTFSKGNILKTDIIENEQEYVVKVDVPGIDKSLIKVDIEDGYLNIMINKDDTKEDENINYIKKERRIESCKRSFYIGEVVKENVKAKIENGILILNIPKVTQIVEEKKYITIE